MSGWSTMCDTSTGCAIAILTSSSAVGRVAHTGKQLRDYFRSHAADMPGSRDLVGQESGRRGAGSRAAMEPLWCAVDIR